MSEVVLGYIPLRLLPPHPSHPHPSARPCLLLKCSTVFLHRISSWEPSIQIHEPAGDIPYNNNTLLDFKIPSKKVEKKVKEYSWLLSNHTENGKYFNSLHMAFQLYMRFVLVSLEYLKAFCIVFCFPVIYKNRAKTKIL